MGVELGEASTAEQDALENLISDYRYNRVCVHRTSPLTLHIARCCNAGEFTRHGTHLNPTPPEHPSPPLPRARPHFIHHQFS